MVVSELRGEKIDIIPHNDEPARFVAKALSPARVREVIVDDEERQATVIVPDDQLSLAIGRDGQNARLAARLTGWRVDIKSETEFASGGRGDRVRGRGAVRRPLHGGALQRPPLPERRDPRLDLLRPAPAPGAVRFETSQVAVLATVSEAEVAILADPDADEGQVDEIVDRAAAEFVEEVEEAPPRSRGRGRGSVAEEEAERGSDPSRPIAEDAAEEASEAEATAERRVAADERPSEPEPVAEEAEQA